MMPSPTQLHRDALAIGTMLNGYQIRGVLGRGGFGITYRASDLLDQSFAIKEFFPRQFAMRAGQDVVVTSDSDEAVFVDCRRRFLMEARLLASLGRNGGTPGIVQVATFFEANNTAYSVMELLSGETLADRLKSEREPLSPAVLVSLLRGILKPLARVHAAGFLHRDIKPANILIRPDGQPILIDFGSARDMGPTSSTTYTQVYSGHYAPIEQMIQGAIQGPFSDLYSVGGVAYRAIGGNLVDARARQQALMSHAPDPLIAAAHIGRGRYPLPVLNAIDRSLALAACDRPQRVDDMLDLLDAPPNHDDVVTRLNQPRVDGTARPPSRNTKMGSRVVPASFATAEQPGWLARVRRRIGAVDVLRLPGLKRVERFPRVGVAMLAAAVLAVLAGSYMLVFHRSEKPLAALHVVLATDERGTTAKFPDTTDDAALAKALPQLAKLNVTTLDLSNTHIVTLPSLQALGGLQILSLRGSSVSYLQSLGGLTALRELDLSHTKLTTLPSVQDLGALQKLDLSYTDIVTLPPLEALGSLQALDLSHTNVATVPSLERLTSLRSLDLTDTRIASLPQLQLLPLVQVTPASLAAPPEPAITQRVISALPPIAQPSQAPERPIAEPDLSPVTPLPPVPPPARIVKPPPPRVVPNQQAEPRLPTPPKPAPPPAKEPPASSDVATAAPAKPAERDGHADGGETAGSGYEFFQRGYAASEMQHYAEARNLYLAGAAKGDAHCMYSLGLLYAAGNGVAADYTTARSWYMKAADRGYSIALYNLGLLYIGGGPGVARDCNAAHEWFEKAAARGVSAAKTFLSGSRCQ